MPFIINHDGHLKCAVCLGVPTAACYGAQNAKALKSSSAEYVILHRRPNSLHVKTLAPDPRMQLYACHGAAAH
jgi:hypothetical protein